MSAVRGEGGDVMIVTVKEIAYDELIDRIREQSARIHETDSDELIMKETANERDQRRDHLDDHL